MRLSIKAKLFLMISGLVMLLVILLMSFTSLFIGDIFIDKYETLQIELFSSFQEDYSSTKDIGALARESSSDFKGFISIFDKDMRIKESTTPGQKRGNHVQPEFLDLVLEVINDPNLTYRTFVLDALHGEGDTMLLVGKLNEREYVIFDKPLNFIVEVVEIINSAMLTFLILVLVLGLFISYLASSIFTRPILKIRTAVKAIAVRDFSYKLNIKNNDELGDLGHIINEISDQIRDNFEEIESQNEILDRDKVMLEEMNNQLRDLSETDALTKLNNRLKIDRVLEYELKNSKITGSTFSVIMLDIDYFKLVNDGHGHLEGDKVLVKIANILTEDSRRLDMIGRWGGEEFIIVLPGTVLSDAINKAEKLRNSVATHDFGVVGTLTSSFGVGEYTGNLPLNNFIKLIDDALYSAKENGRNRVEKIKQS